MSAVATRLHPALKPIAGATLGLLAGIGLGMARDASPKEYAPALGALVFLLIITAWKYGEQFCLFSFLLAVPLPMHAFFYKLDPLHGGGALGLYAKAADGPFLLLLVFWFLDWAKKRPGQPYSSKLALLLLPFLFISGLTITFAKEPMWAFCEWFRWLKVFAILLYASRRLRGRDVDVVLFSLAASVALEGGISALQAVTRSKLGLDKLGIFGSGGEQAVTQEVAIGTLFRGSALTGHPNYLAGYLLLLLPIFGILALSETVRWRKLCWTATFVLGAAGLGATMSRAAIASFGGACVMALIGALIYRLTTFRRASLITAVAVLGISGVGLYFQDAIRERLRADWDASWELRKHLNTSAIDMADDNIVLGVGLNNYTIEYPAYNPDFAAKLIEMENMLTTVHNLYLLVWAEVGTVGLATFLVFLIGSMIAAWRALPSLDKRGQSVMIGFICGLAGAMVNDMTEFALWIEICMYTLPILIGMLPALREASATAALRGRT